MSESIHPVDLLVGQRVRFLRLGCGMSQTGLASHLGLTFQQVQKYEKGTNRISASKLVEIAQALSVDVSDLFSDASNLHAAKARSSQNALAASQVDVAILRKLSGIRDSRVKRRILALISAFTDKAGSSSASARN